MTDLLQLDVHAFGSRKGYRMLAASPGVTEAEQAALDPMTSGVAEVGPSAEVASRSIAMLVRTLPGGRIALTRWFTGSQDDAGRPTVALRTLLFTPQDWRAHGRCLARPLMEQHEVWDSAAFGTGARASLAPPEAMGQRTDRDVFRLADLVRPGAMPLRLVDDRPMREALVGLVERMCPDEAVHLQWGVGLSHVARGLDIMTLTRGGLIESLEHPWHRDDLRDATGNDVPSLTAPQVLGLEPEPATTTPVALPISAGPANWQPTRRRRSLAPLIAVVLAVVVILAVLLMSQRGTTPESQGEGSPDGASATAPPSSVNDKATVSGDSPASGEVVVEPPDLADGQGFGRSPNNVVGVLDQGDEFAGGVPGNTPPPLGDTSSEPPAAAGETPPAVVPRRRSTNRRPVQMPIRTRRRANRQLNRLLSPRVPTRRAMRPRRCPSMKAPMTLQPRMTSSRTRPHRRP